MKPLNTAERAARLRKFVLLYLLALAVPIGAAYLLFADNSARKENEQLKKELARTRNEQQTLLGSMDTLTHQLQRIDAIDKQMLNERNDLVLGELSRKNQDHLTGVALALSEIRRDSTTTESLPQRRMAANVLRDFDMIRNYRSTIDFLREELRKTGRDTQDGTREREQCALKLAQATQELNILRALANRPPAGGGGGGGGGKPNAQAWADLQNKLNASEAQIRHLRESLAFTNADCRVRRTEDESRKDRRKLLEQAKREFLELEQTSDDADMKQRARQGIETVDKKIKILSSIF